MRAGHLEVTLFAIDFNSGSRRYVDVTCDLERRCGSTTIVARQGGESGLACHGDSMHREQFALLRSHEHM